MSQLSGAETGVPAFGPRWSELFAAPKSHARQPRDPWWLGKREKLLALAADELPAYVYDVDSIRLAAQNLAIHEIGRPCSLFGQGKLQSRPVASHEWLWGRFRVRVTTGD